MQPILRKIFVVCWVVASINKPLDPIIIMKKLLISLCVGLSLSLSPDTGFAATPAQSRLGINLSGLADWSTDYPFVDVFRMSRKWISQSEGAGWGKGPELVRDANGWITHLETNCWADTPLLTGSNGHAPAGDYVCLFDGEGEINFQYAKVISREPGRIVVRINSETTAPTGGGIFLGLRSTNPTNYVRNIRVIMPGFEKTYRDQVFSPPFLTRWNEFNTFRFMDWLHTNGSHQREWSDRATTNYCNYTERGIPVEVMIDLCNRLKINPWFNIPHLASDDYVRQFAALVQRALDPRLKAYVEYSNEVWNSMFEQHRYAEAKGKEMNLGPESRPWEGAAVFYGLRSQQIFKIWEDACGSRARLVRVIAWQAAGGTYWTDGMVLGKNETGKNADALAIAPYMTLCIGPGTKPNSDTVADWTVDQVLDYTETNALPECLEWTRSSKTIADKYGLRLVCYESGQHLVGVGGGENNEKMTQVFQAANRHPRMGVLYTKYLDALNKAGVDLTCLWCSTGKWSKWGSWGLTEYWDETGATQPKFKAVCDWNQQHTRP